MTKLFDIFKPLTAALNLRRIGLCLLTAGMMLTWIPKSVQAQTLVESPNSSDFGAQKALTKTQDTATKTKVIETGESLAEAALWINPIGLTVKVTKKVLGGDADVLNESDHYGKIGSTLEKLKTEDLGTRADWKDKWWVPDAITDDSRGEDLLQNLQEQINDGLKEGKINQDEANLLRNEGLRVYNDRMDQIIKEKCSGKTGTQRIECEKKYENARRAALNNENIIVGRECPTVTDLRAKYQSGCWSCLVVERLVSAFLNTAEDAYGLAQRAGLILLAIGTVLWILLWGLKNVSSLTQLEPANIVNDLIKFAFKLALAYFFITAGLTPVREYFITPIMGTGAVIAQQFWPQKFRDSGATEDFIWEDYDYDEIEKDYEAAKKEQEKFIKGETSDISTEKPLQVNEEAARKLEIAKKKALKSLPAEGSNIAIPAFQLPGAAGTFVSPFGCRPAPITQRNNRGSTIHKGVDIAAGVGTPVYAIGSGSITYSNSRTGGYMATIVHDDGSKKWTSMYMHMQPKSSGFAVNYNRQANPKAERAELFHVAQGQQIGFVGNTGNSSGYHLHLAIKYNGDLVDPLNLINKKVVFAPRNCPIPTTEANRTKPPAQFKRDQTKFDTKGIGIGGTGTVDLSSTFVAGTDYGKSESSLVIANIGDIKYTGSTKIMPQSVMDSILGATKVITDTTAENMVLGNAITCYSGLDKGGAWHIKIADWNMMSFTNVVMWIEGALIWCTGFLLTLAVVYYLMDISFKIGFAVIALPIVVGLWPFNLTKGKFSICVSIIAKSAATFAFLAITTSYAMNLVSAALEGRTDDGKVAVSSVTDLTDKNESGGGLNALLEAMETANTAESLDANKDNVEYVANRLAVFSFDFIILLFCFIYSYKLIQATVPQFVNKFFPDKAFGDSQPMHHWATAATRWAKDQAMKPASLAKDIALHQTGNLAKNAVGKTIGAMRGSQNAKGGGAESGKGKGGAGEAAGAGVEGAGKGVKAVGKGIKGVSQAANAIPVVGQVVAATGKAVGTAVEAGGAAIEKAGKEIKKQAQKAGQEKEKNEKQQQKSEK